MGGKKRRSLAPDTIPGNIKKTKECRSGMIDENERVA
jgi:hypothetical protein